MKHFFLHAGRKRRRKKEEKIYSLQVKIEHIKRENNKSSKRNKQIIEEFSNSEEETMETITEEKVLTTCDFACNGESTMRKHMNTNIFSVHSDIGEGTTDKI